MTDAFESMETVSQSLNKLEIVGSLEGGNAIEDVPAAASRRRQCSLGTACK